MLFFIGFFLSPTLLTGYFSDWIVHIDRDIYTTFFTLHDSYSI